MAEESPGTIFAVYISGVEHHFGEYSYRELKEWLDNTIDSIKIDGEKHRWTRFTTENSAGEELNFGFTDVQYLFVSTPESRRFMKEEGKLLIAERKSWGFIDDD